MDCAHIHTGSTKHWCSSLLERERMWRRITNRCVSTRDDKILLHKRKHLGYVMLPWQASASYLGKLVKYRKNMSPKHWTLLQIIFFCCNLSLRPCRIMYQRVAHVIYKRWRHAAISRPPLPRNCLLRSAEPHARASTQDFALRRQWKLWRSCESSSFSSLEPAPAQLSQVTGWERSRRMCTNKTYM